jgi:hypothetical protein
MMRRDARRLRLSVVTRAALAVLVSLASRSAAAVPVFDEYQVKAAFLLNIARFVDWPPGGFAQPTAPLTFCIVGSDPFGPHLDEAFSGRQVAGHQLEVRRLASVAPAGCHVLFLGGSDPSKVSAALAQVGRAAVLTVGDTRSFAAAGGAIALYVDDQRVRFEVNVAASNRAGLTISARVLALASAVHREGAAR